MSTHRRLSEKWFTRGLWLISLIFAGFLIGLGGSVIRDLPKAESDISFRNFMDTKAELVLDEQEKEIYRHIRDIDEERDNQKIVWDSASRNYQQAKETHQEWLRTRAVIQNSDKDQALIERMEMLEQIKGIENNTEDEYKLIERKYEITNTELAKVKNQKAQLQSEAYALYNEELRARSIRVFLYRLLITLPLLVVAGYMFAKKRKNRYWPFVWGFILFALFAFFVELVPYLPSYGGYVRYGVGIIMTLLVGHYSIRGLQHYLDNQKKSEEEPENMRRQKIEYDQALARLAKHACPGCERPVPHDDYSYDFCAHCGINLHSECGKCHTRKSNFEQFCHSCGTKSEKDLG